MTTLKNNSVFPGPNDVTDPWRGLYQATRLPAPTEYGDIAHPDIPSWPDDREDALDKLVHAQGFDFQVVAGEFTQAALEDGDELYWEEMRAWHPEAPEGEWRLAWKGDTEDGPYAWFVRPMALRPEPAALAARQPAVQDPDPTLLRFYQATDYPSLVSALEAHVLKLIDTCARNVKPWEDTFPPTLLPKWRREQAAQGIDLEKLWINVNDRLPTEEDYGEHGDVLVRYRYNTPNSVHGEWDVGESSHDASDMQWNNGWLFGSCDYAEVSHWMPKSALLAVIDQRDAAPGVES